MVEAEIEATVADYSDDERIIVEREYYMTRARLPSGALLEFGEDQALGLGSRSAIIDNGGRWWYAELTDEKVR